MMHTGKDVVPSRTTWASAQILRHKQVKAARAFGIPVRNSAPFCSSFIVLDHVQSCSFLECYK